MPFLRISNESARPLFCKNHHCDMKIPAFTNEDCRMCYGEYTPTVDY